MTEDKFDLSRRKVLGSLGVVGTGAVLGGAGTAALFSDQDNVDSNMVQAGELDLEIDYEAKNKGTAKTVERSGNGDLEGFSFKDIKPGDDGYVEVSLTPSSNPAWIWMQGQLTLNAENGFTEPERDVDDTSADGDWDGELADKIDATLQDADGNVVADDTLYNVFDQISSGIRIADQAVSADNTESIRLDWSVDSGVGNIIQTDKAKFDLSFYAEQRRHNDNPSNPFSN